MDKLDRKILQVLDWQGREPVSTIAKQVGSNKDVAAYRIKKLEQDGIIVRYFPIIDMGRLGYITSRLYFDLEEMTADDEKAFVTFLDKTIKASLIFRMDYPYRYGIFLWTPCVYDVEDIIKKIKQHLGRILVRYHHSVICSLHQYPKDYLFGKKHHDTEIRLAPQEKENVDKDDLAILRQLANNARISTVDIADHTKIPQTTVSSKIKQLEKRKIILGYRAEIDFIKLGFMNYFLEIYLGTNDDLKQIEQWAGACLHVVWLQKIIGACDIEIEVEVKDRTALEILLNELRQRFPNIRKIVFWSQVYKKMTFLP